MKVLQIPLIFLYKKELPILTVPPVSFKNFQSNYFGFSIFSSAK